MNVLHITAGDINFGAAKGAYSLHKELIQNGLQSRLLLQVGKQNTEEGVYIISDSKLNKLRRFCYTQLDALPVKLYTSRKKEIFSLGLFGFDIISNPLYKWADIIHLHWINQGMIKIQDFKRIEKPIVWTFRDMWPMTGGCHHSFSCDRYTKSCGSCPHLNSDSHKDLSHYILQMKKKYFGENIFPVTISKWLAECGQASSLFTNYHFEVIPNGIDTSVFTPFNKEEVRRELGISTEKKIVLLGASNLNEIYKGFDKFSEALNFLRKEYFFIFFGNVDHSYLERYRIQYKTLGIIKDTQRLAKVYSAADVFVAPSIAEAFGKTLAESFSCGTPVVCFDATGPKDIVDHKINGYKAVAFDPADLAAGIDWVLENDQRLNELSIQARDKAVSNFSSQLIAKNYINLYQKLA